MTDIKIEKTAGGYKAEFEGNTLYSYTGFEWLRCDGTMIFDNKDAPLCAAFITQYIDPPTEPEAPALFKVGDWVVCVDAYEHPHRLTNGKQYKVTKLGGTYLYVSDNNGRQDGFNDSRFILAPEPKVYTGEEVLAKAGVYREIGATEPRIILVDALKDSHTLFIMPYHRDHKWGILSGFCPGITYHQIAESITDIFVDGIMDMEAI